MACKIIIDCAEIKSPRTEYRLSITETANGNDFTFLLRGNRLSAQPASTNRDAADWYESLTGEEKIKLMQTVLAYYRAPSLDPNGMKAAAIGIVENTDLKARPSQKHLIYVGVNTTQSASALYKDCAEQNMVNAATASIARRQYHDSNLEKTEKIVPPRFKEVYVMGGRDADMSDPNDKGVPAICPCGKCTDMLAKSMDPNGKIFVLPHAKDKELTCNSDAVFFSRVKPEDGQYWETTIDRLNAHRDVGLEKGVHKAQKEALVEVAAKLVKYAPPSVEECVIEKAADNARHRRNSIAALDVATDAKTGQCDTKVMSSYLYHQILTTLDDRLTRDEVVRTPEEISQWLHSPRMETVRCVVLQLSDGTYHSAIDSQTSPDKAYPNAGVSALGAAVQQLGTQGVVSMWAMECSPKAIEKGLLPTSPKEEVERIAKRIRPRSTENTEKWRPFEAGYFVFGEYPRNKDCYQEFGISKLYPAAFGLEPRWADKVQCFPKADVVKAK